VTAPTVPTAPTMPSDDKAERATYPAIADRSRVVDIIASNFLDTIDGRAIEFVDGYGALRQIRRTDEDNEWEERRHGCGEGEASGDYGTRWDYWGPMGWHQGERIGPGLVYPEMMCRALALAADQVIEDTIPQVWDEKCDEEWGPIKRDPVEDRWALD